MNLDGGGSVRKMHENKVVNAPIENRPVDNVFCVYLKEDPLAKLADQNEIASWARPYVEKMVASGMKVTLVPVLDLGAVPIFSRVVTGFPPSSKRCL